MPEFPISTHLFKCGWKAKISKDGSVYGLYAGLKRKSFNPARQPRSRLGKSLPCFPKKVDMNPIKSPSVKL